MPKPTPPPSVADLVIEALRARAEQRKRACTALAANLNEDREAGKDVRSGAVKLVDELAQADRMLALADELEHGAVRITRVVAEVEFAGMPAIVSPDADPETVALVEVTPPAVDPALVDLVPEHEQDEPGDAEIITVAL